MCGLHDFYKWFPYVFTEFLLIMEDAMQNIFDFQKELEMEIAIIERSFSFLQAENIYGHRKIEA